MGVGVPEGVGVDRVEIRLPGSSPEHLLHPRSPHPTLPSEPQPRLLSVSMMGPQPEIPVQGLHGPMTDREQPDPLALAGYGDEPLVEVHIRKSHADELCEPSPGVVEQPDDCGISAVLELRAGTGIEQGPNLLLAQDRRRVHRDPRGTHPDHRGVRDLSFFFGPPPELLNALEVGQGGRWLSSPEELLEPSLDVLPSDRPDLLGHLRAIEERGQVPERVAVCGLGPGGEVGGPEVAGERGARSRMVGVIAVRFTRLLSEGTRVNRSRSGVSTASEA